MESDSSTPGEGVPFLLYSAYSGQPFTRCIECESELLESWTPYAVEKVIRHGEVVFEYAICADCMVDFSKKFSEESLENIRNYLSEEAGRPFAELNIEDLMDAMLDEEVHGLDDPKPTQTEAPSVCSRCGLADPHYRDEHVLTGILVGRRPLISVKSICNRCSEGMEDILSQSTRDAHDDFIRQHFPGVPENLDLPISVFSI